MNVVLDYINRMYLNRDIDSTINMQLSTESLDLLDESPYQTEISFNQLLPYADKLDNESNNLLAQIKYNFGKCAMLRDINPGCVYWSNMLTKYIALYGMRFQKDEHIAFIKLAYELIIIPNLEASLVDNFSNLLITLLKKKETISPTELEVHWEPLYKLCNDVFEEKSKKYTLTRYPPKLEQSLKILIKKIRIYFPPNATQEILNELRPKICPLDKNRIKTTMRLLEWFLPTELPPEQHAIGHQLWFQEFMRLWDVCNNSSYVGTNMMNLMAKLASNNIGYIDWDPYLPVMFTRIVCTLNLPVHYKKIVCKSNNSLDVDAMGEWIASVLGDHSKAQVHLDKFFKTVETYYHPANYGPYLGKLVHLYVKIIYYVVLRLYRERFAKESWIYPIPESHKLTDANIDALVSSMMPIATMSLFNRYCSIYLMHGLRYLVMLRPNMVIPKILEKIYPSLGSDIEPHKMVTAMNCMMMIARPLVQGSRFTNKDYAFAEGPTHVLSILFSSLPGIDPNDPTKCFAAFKLISTYASLVPIVDCSKTKAETNEEERLICEETSRFEDFILQLIDKIFVLINSSSLENVRLENQSHDGEKNVFESMAEVSLFKMFTILLLQTSDSIFVIALNKLRSFIMENTLETKISGHMVAILCNVFSRVNGQVTLKNLVPFLSDQILSALDNEDATNEEHLDNQLMYFLLLLQRVVETQGDVLLPYVETITKVLDKVTVLKSVEGNHLGCQMLKNVLNSLCSIQAIKFNQNLDDSEYPYWTDWGMSSEVKSSEIKWYVPGELEIEAAQGIFVRYFVPAIKAVQKYVNMENILSRDSLQTTLRVINSVIEGCDSVLPSWIESPLVDEKFKSCAETFEPIVGNNHEIKMPDGRNVRQFLVQIMTSLQHKMLQNVEDDTKSLMLLSQMWLYVSGNKSKQHPNVTFKRHQLLASKKIIEDKLTGNKGYLPQILMQRVALQHDIRKTHASRAFTKTSQDIILNLFELSISRYSRIRIGAQIILSSIINDFPNAYRVLVPRIVEILQRDSEIYHDAYKGVLYILIPSQGNSLLSNDDWQALSDILSALVLSKPSEKPSLILLQNNVVLAVNSFSPSTNFELDVPDNCVSVASQLWNTGDISLNSAPPAEVEIQVALQAFKMQKAKDLEIYNEILLKLVQPVLEGKLHWRHRQMAMQFISSIVHPDLKLPIPVMRCFLNALVHDSIVERKLAWTMTTHILKSLKRKHPKIVLDIPNRMQGFKPGRRPDNEFLQYKLDNLPLSAENWDKPIYIDKAYIGYYTWPKSVEIYAPSSQQPCLDEGLRQLSAEEQEIDEFFRNEQKVQNLLKFLQLEEKKGKDKFNHYRYLMFKGLFRNYGDAYFGLFLRRLETMVQDKQENVQRCAAEIICGLVRGSKHWPFHMVQNMWHNLLPIIKLVLANLTEETINDWSTCFSLIFKNRDPRRLHWLIECIVAESLLAQAEASFVECARLVILQEALKPHSWRLSELFDMMMPRLKARLLENPFENVRDGLACTLVTIFNTNLKFQNTEENETTGYPELSAFIDEILPRLQSLSDKGMDPKLECRIEAIRLLNTVCRCIIESISVSNYGLDPSFYKLFPIISQLENDETDEGLAQTCTSTMAVLAHTVTLPEYIPTVIFMMQKMSCDKSWSARANIAQFLQIFLFHNMSVLLSQDEWIEGIKKMVLQLMQDERLEVRERAAQVLNGMLHCTLIDNKMELLEEFKRLAKSKFSKNSNYSSEYLESDKIKKTIMRHAGVLGMCAFIQAHPYDIPADIPPLFEHLSLHLNDQEPIPTTIRRVLNDFKRTHCDGWQGLQGLAQDLTEEQFELLQDLVMPPSYYA